MAGKWWTAGAAARLAAGFVVGAGLALGTPGMAGAAEIQITALAGGATGSWFRELTAMSECLRQHSDIRMTVQPTSGGMEQFAKMSMGQADVGFNYQSVVRPAWYSKGPFTGKPPMRAFRAIGVAEEAAAAHYVVLADSGITSLKDLVGKQFAPGPIGTVTYQVTLDLLKAMGLEGKVGIANVSHGEMVGYLKDGKIAGWGLLGGIPNPAATEQAAVANIRLLDVGKDMVDSGFLKENPFFVKTVITAGTYRGVDKDVTTFAQNGILFANDKVSDEKIYALTKALWSPECIAYLAGHNRALKAMEGDPLVGVVMPLHPGAARFWKEKGRDTSKIPAVKDM